MEYRAVVVAILAVTHEILAGLGHDIAIQFQVQWSVGGHQSNVAFLFHAFVSNDVILQNGRFVDVDGRQGG